MSQLGSFEKVLRIGEGRRMKRLAEQAAYITSIEPEFRELSDEQLRDKTVEFRQRLENGETSRNSCSRPSPRFERHGSGSPTSACSTSS